MIQIDYDFIKYDVLCDVCCCSSSIEVSEDLNFREINSEIKQLGWITEKIDGKWCDFCCQECYEKYIEEFKYLNNLKKKQEYAKAINAHYCKRGTCKWFRTLTDEDAIKLDKKIKDGTKMEKLEIRSLNFLEWEDIEKIVDFHLKHIRSKIIIFQYDFFKNVQIEKVNIDEDKIHPFTIEFGNGSRHELLCYGWGSYVDCCGNLRNNYKTFAFTEIGYKNACDYIEEQRLSLIKQIALNC